MDEVLLPARNLSPRRRDGLWQGTCLEFFVAVSGSPHYQEVNLSPSGDWNVYTFSDYRQGMQEYLAVRILPFKEQRQPESYRLALDFPLAKFIAPEQTVEAAVSAVLQGKNGQRCFPLR